VLGKAGQLGVWTGTSEDSRVARCNDTSALTLERPGDDRRPAALLAAANDLVDEFNEIIREPNRDLSAHPRMVPQRDAPTGTQSRDIDHRREC